MTTIPESSLIVPDVLLAPRTTIGVGGSARWLATVTDEDQLREALRWAGEVGVPLFVLGGGSNVVIADRGFDGLVIDVALRGIRCTERNGGVLLEVAAGERWDDVVDYAVTRGLTGVECLSGIPGRVGASPIQNVGAYGQEVAETIVAVNAVSRHTGEHALFSPADCGFGYRDSVFKHTERDKWIITSVTFSLDRDRPPTIRYAELERTLGGESPTLPAVRGAVIRLRQAKGMVIDAQDPDSRSVGSFFMNPVVDDSSLEDLFRRVADRGIPLESVPRFAAPAGTKLSAGWLIEHAGFSKGDRREGGAGISSKHSLAIINTGGATASSIRALADEIEEKVRETFGIALEPEASWVGW